MDGEGLRVPVWLLFECRRRVLRGGQHGLVLLRGHQRDRARWCWRSDARVGPGCYPDPHICGELLAPPTQLSYYCGRSYGRWQSRHASAARKHRAAAQELAGASNVLGHQTYIYTCTVILALRSHPPGRRSGHTLATRARLVRHRLHPWSGHTPTQQLPTGQVTPLPARSQQVTAVALAAGHTRV